MAVSAYHNTYTAIGNREDLADTIADLFADDAPAYAMAKKVRATGTKHEWQADALADAAGTAVIEGADVSYTKRAFRARHINYTHIRLRNWAVTHTQKAVTTAGVKNEMKRELMMAMKELIRDYDKILLATTDSGAGSTAAGRTSRGIQSAIQTNSGGGTGGGGTSKVYLTEARVNSTLQDIWNQGGDPRALFCAGYQKRVISQNFTAKTGFSWNQNASTRAAINNINKYEGSFGTLDIIPDRQNPGMRIAIVDPNHWRVAVLQDIKSYKGAKTASAYKGWVEAEMCLEWGNEKAHGLLNYLNTSGALTG